MIKPKIAYIMQPFDKVIPPNQNSLGILILETARRLVPDFDVTIYLRNISYTIDDFYKYGIHFRAIPLNYDHQFMRFKKVTPILFENDKKLFSRRYYPFYQMQIARDLKRNPVDIVQILNHIQYSQIIRMFNPGTKIVLRMGCEWLSQVPDETQKYLKYLDLIIGCSHFITNRIEKKNDLKSTRCQPVHNGVDITMFTPDDTKKFQNVMKSPQLLYVGRISPEKGVHIMIEALHQIKRVYPDVKLTLVGSTRGQLPKKYLIDLSDEEDVKSLEKFYVTNKYSEYYDTLVSMIRKYKLEDNIHFAGGLSNHEIIKYYQSADVFLFPSICNEAFGIPVIEAMSSGIPVVASRTGGIPEIIENGENGFLVERNNGLELANAVLKIVEDPNRLQEMGLNARMTVEKKFNWDSISENLKELYFSLLNGKSGYQKSLIEPKEPRIRVSMLNQN